MDMRAWEKQTVRLPVRSRRTVRSAGASTVESVVFCPLLARSTPLDLCEQCPRRSHVEEDGAAIVCEVELPRNDGPARVDVAEAAACTYVGEIVSPATSCVREDVAAELVIAVLNATRRCVPIVTASGGLVGVVCPGALFRGPRGGADRPTARDLARSIDVVLTEDMALSVAIGVLAHSGEPELPVVTSAGAVMGMLSASDVVRWMASRLGYHT